MGAGPGAIHPWAAWGLGIAMCLAIPACAHRVPAALESSLTSEGAFASSAGRFGPWSWGRITSHLPGTPRRVEWRPAGGFRQVRIHAAPGAIDAGEASLVAQGIQSAIDYLSPEGVDSPVGRVELYLVPSGVGSSDSHASVGRTGHLTLRFHVRQLDTVEAQRAYSAGIVAHELAHVRRRIARIPADESEETVATMLEYCAVLSAVGEVSPDFNALAFASAETAREEEMVASARAAARLADSLPATVRAGTPEAASVLAACESLREGSPVRRRADAAHRGA